MSQIVFNRHKYVLFLVFSSKHVRKRLLTETRKALIFGMYIPIEHAPKTVVIRMSFSLGFHYCMK